LTKKELIESIKINEDDYSYISLNILPEIYEKWCELIKKYFNFTCDELTDSSNIGVCYNYYIWKYNPIDFRKSLHNLNILNQSVCQIIYYNGMSIDEFFTKMCCLTDIELFYVLQNFMVRFYNLIAYLTAKQIKLDNLTDEFFDSYFIDEEFVLFMRFMVNHGYYDINIKRLDFMSDINRFFKIKNIDCINPSKVRGRDDVLMIIISKMFRVVFYKVLIDLNRRNKIDEARLQNDTLDIIDELYKYFYSKVFVDMSNDPDGVVCQDNEWTNESEE
jgi:hypothetical protein